MSVLSCPPRIRLNDPVTLKVVTEYQGSAADHMREQIAETSSRSELEQSFLEYYSQAYPEIEAYLPYSIKDLRSVNRLTLTEYYRIRGFWQPTEEDGVHVTTLFPQAVYDRMDRPSRTMRSSPYELDHPVEVDPDDRGHSARALARCSQSHADRKSMVPCCRLI